MDENQNQTTTTVTLSARGLENIFNMPCISGIHKDPKTGLPMFMVNTDKGGLALCKVGDKIVIKGNLCSEIIHNL